MLNVCRYLNRKIRIFQGEYKKILDNQHIDSRDNRNIILLDDIDDKSGSKITNDKDIAIKLENVIDDFMKN